MTESWTQSGVEYFIVYLYDESGAPIGMQYRTSNYAYGEFDNYYFEKNLFGDIVAVYNESGTKIGSYKYDAWGACTAVPGVGTTYVERNILNNLNPFRYRGYYYDTETGFYYLQSRYYNPQWGRFLNADGYINANGDLIGFNMYAYCSNNPVMYTDPQGESLTGILIVAAIVIVCTTILVSCDSIETDDENAYSEYQDYVQNGEYSVEYYQANSETDISNIMDEVYSNISAKGHETALEYGATIYTNSTGTMFAVEYYSDHSINSCIFRHKLDQELIIVAGIHYHPSGSKLSSEDIDLAKKYHMYVGAIAWDGGIYDEDKHLKDNLPNALNKQIEAYTKESK